MGYCRLVIYKNTSKGEKIMTLLSRCYVVKTSSNQTPVLKKDIHQRIGELLKKKESEVKTTK